MWYVIQVKCGSEVDICKKCRQALPISVCSDIFVPKFQKLMKFKDIWKKEERILFPGYVFVKSEKPQEVKRYLKPLNAIVRPVSIGGGFYPIRKEEETFLQNVMDKNYVLNTSKGYVVDGSLVVTQGPLIRYADYVKRFDRHKRIGELEIALWGEKRKVMVGLEVVARVTAAEFESVRGKAG